MNYIVDYVPQWIIKTGARTRTTLKMADEDVNGDSDEVQQEKSQKKIAKYDSGAADLEKVTDYAEEKEITSSEDISSVS